MGICSGVKLIGALDKLGYDKVEELDGGKAIYFKTRNASKTCLEEAIVTYGDDNAITWVEFISVYFSKGRFIEAVTKDLLTMYELQIEEKNIDDDSSYLTIRKKTNDYIVGGLV